MKNEDRRELLQIIDNYYLDADSYGFIVKRKMRNQKTGEAYYDNEAYCGNLKHVKSWILENIIQKDLQLLNNIERVLEMSQSIDLAFDEYLSIQREKPCRTAENALE